MSSNATITREDVCRILAQGSPESFDEIMTFFNETPIRMPSLKLADLKVLAKFLKERGYEINVQVNKGPLEASLVRIISSLPSSKADVATTNILPATSSHIQNTTQSNSHYSNSVNSSVSSIPISNTSSTETNYSITKQSSLVAVASQPPTHQPPRQQPPSFQPLSKHVPQFQPQSLQAPKPQVPIAQQQGKYPPHIEDKLKSLNSKKRRIFDESVAISGMTPSEVLDALKIINTADCTIDAVIEKVVIKRSISCDPKDDENIAALERSLYDRTVMESEKERDNIQQRKRQRIIDLKNDIQSQIFPYEDFRNSLLMFGLNPPNNSSSSSSSNSSSQAVLLSKGITVPKLSQGSILIRGLVFLFDFVASDSRSLELCELISSPLGSVRVSLVEILLMERDALKFYKNASYAYLLSLKDKFDALINSEALPPTFVNELYKVSNTNALTPQQWRKLFAGLSASYDSIQECLSQVKEAFQKGTVKIPRDGGLVPEIFRLKPLLPYVRLLSSNVESDGIELIDDYHNLGLLSERESESSSSDDDDIEDDDDY